MAKTLAGWVSNLPHTFSSLQGVARDMDDSSENVGQDGIHWYLHKLGDAFSRLCRLMCGRFSTSRVGLQLSSGLCPKSRAGGHSPEENWRHPLRVVENLPHIRRHSRENASPNLCRYQWMPSCPTYFHRFRASFANWLMTPPYPADARVNATRQSLIVTDP